MSVGAHPGAAFLLLCAAGILVLNSVFLLVCAVRGRGPTYTVWRVAGMVVLSVLVVAQAMTPTVRTHQVDVQQGGCRCSVGTPWSTP